MLIVLLEELTMKSQSTRAAKSSRAIHVPAVCMDHQRRTCLLVNHDGATAEYIPFSIDGFKICVESVNNFDQQYQPLSDYPPDRCAKLYASYARDLGATEEVLTYLGQITPLSQLEKEMAIKKQATQEAVKETTAAKRAAAKSATKPATKAAAKKPATKAAAKPTETSGERKPSAAQRFQELIMAGKMTDDQIFATVKAEFGLDDKKRGYVHWYRNYLTKQGKNPPAAK